MRGRCNSSELPLLLQTRVSQRVVCVGVLAGSLALGVCWSHACAVQSCVVDVLLVHWEGCQGTGLTAWCLLTGEALCQNDTRMQPIWKVACHWAGLLLRGAAYLPQGLCLVCKEHNQVMGDVFWLL